MLIKEPWKIDVLVNKNNWLPRNYEHYDLIKPKINFLPDTADSAKQMRKEAGKALEKLFMRAKKDRLNLYAVSGYRSFQRQREIFKSNYLKDGEKANKYSARPGQSEHQTGLAIDLTCANANFELSDAFEKTMEYKWLKKYAYNFGFVFRYPKEKESITGYIFEPWHLRYVGKELAKELNERKLTLEEYFGIS